MDSGNFIIYKCAEIILFFGRFVNRVFGIGNSTVRDGGTWGCFIGTIVGVFFFPIGLVSGPFLGAFLGELLAGKTAHAALRGGVGAFLGFLAGTVLKLAVCIAIGFSVFMRLF